MNATLSARQALETALGESCGAFRSIQRQLKEGPLRTAIAAALRAVELRRQRLVTLPEMPMRIAEAQEVQESIASIEHQIRTAPEPLRLAVREAVRPLREVLQQYTIAKDGGLRFPEERHVPLRQPSVQPTESAPLASRAREILARIFRRRS